MRIILLTTLLTISCTGYQKEGALSAVEIYCQEAKAGIVANYANAKEHQEISLSGDSEAISTLIAKGVAIERESIEKVNAAYAKTKGMLPKAAHEKLGKVHAEVLQMIEEWGYQVDHDRIYSLEQRIDSVRRELVADLL